MDPWGVITFHGHRLSSLFRKDTIPKSLLRIRYHLSPNTPAGGSRILGARAIRSVAK
jgi:hypothetical protein